LHHTAGACAWTVTHLVVYLQECGADEVLAARRRVVLDEGKDLVNRARDDAAPRPSPVALHSEGLARACSQGRLLRRTAKGEQDGGRSSNQQRRLLSLTPQQVHPYSAGTCLPVRYDGCIEALPARTASVRVLRAKRGSQRAGRVVKAQTSRVDSTAPRAAWSYTSACGLSGPNTRS